MFALRMKRTLLAVGIAVLVSMMFVPHDSAIGIWRGPFFLASIDIIRWDLFVLQTIYVAVLFAVIVNLWPRKK
jgi:hypothetical protein